MRPDTAGEQPRTHTGAVACSVRAMVTCETYLTGLYRQCEDGTGPVLSLHHLMARASRWDGRPARKALQTLTDPPRGRKPQGCSGVPSAVRLLPGRRRLE